MHILDVGIGLENLVESVRHPPHLGGRFDLLEPPTDYWLPRVNEAEELVSGSPLMPTAQSQSEGLVLDRDIPAPVSPKKQIDRPHCCQYSGFIGSGWCINNYLERTTIAMVGFPEDVLFGIPFP